MYVIGCKRLKVQETHQVWLPMAVEAWLGESSRVSVLTLSIFSSSLTLYLFSSCKYNFLSQGQFSRLQCWDSHLFQMSQCTLHRILHLHLFWLCTCSSFSGVHWANLVQNYNHQSSSPLLTVAAQVCLIGFDIKSCDEGDLGALKYFWSEFDFELQLLTWGLICSRLQCSIWRVKTQFFQISINSAYVLGSKITHK